MIDREFERGCQIDILDDNTGIINKCCYKLNVNNWLNDIPVATSGFDVVEVRFKNTRKGFFRNVNQLNLREGELVAVESTQGHDIGIVSLTGELVREQMQRYHVNYDSDFKKIYRKAKQTDLLKWKEAVAQEIPTMLRTRELAKQLQLNMKIGDVEYQGDKTKAIFYYIADERVDFRQLIKHMAEEFKIRVEMKQIGARQEAGRIGGIGPCGRELCCTTWMTNFISVSTNSARLQEISLNPQKLAGQCSKLKCCLNFELEVYIDARKDFIYDNKTLHTTQGDAKHIKNDVFKKTMYFEIFNNNIPVVIALPLQRVKEIIELNKKGIAVDKLISEENKAPSVTEHEFTNDANNGSITRFDSKNRQSNKKSHKKNMKPNNPATPLMLAIVFLISSFSISCDRNKIYEKYIKIDNMVWNDKNYIRFEKEITDTVSRHNIYILVRNATQYRYGNLWVFVSTTAPNGNKDTDTVECVLADKNGKWLGDGMGDLWDNEILWKRNVTFPYQGNYVFQFEQGMRIENLPGILDVGLRIERVPEEK
ncbi:MAG TPA: regulatory iron-sulfur-containing complex subunit RicT [Bacteroidales bacterium]|nr:regulatory iron-sulfur-containing complex subunit RicT [Bacteroidales bacterium]HQP03059.1 regulatory iron-sulfur-containing complex subunit RicT [Bacteroidales bacterium]